MMRLFLFVFGTLIAGGCGSDLGDKERGEACTRDAECEDGLTCEGGVCDAPNLDAGNSPMPDAGDASPDR